MPNSDFYSDFWVHIHPQITEVAKKRFESEEYADSIRAGLRRINSRIRELVVENIGSERYTTREDKELDGTELVYYVFNNKDRPLIVFSPLEKETEKNVHNGYSNLFSGVMLSLRNLTAHKEVEIEKERAVQILFVLSLLMHYLDDSKQYAPVVVRKFALDFIRSADAEGYEGRTEEWKSIDLAHKIKIIDALVSLLQEEKYYSSRLSWFYFIINRGSNSDEEIVKVLEALMEYTYAKYKIKHKNDVFKLVADFLYLEPLNKIVGDKYAETIVNEFINSSSYDTANATSAIIKRISACLSKEQKQKVTNAFLKNNQIYNAFKPKQNLEELLVENSGHLKPDEQERLKKMLEQVTS